MLRISQLALDKAMSDLTQAMISRPDVLRRVRALGGTGQTSNIELRELAENLWPIEDPLVLESWQRVLDSLPGDWASKNEMREGSRSMVHLLMGALRYESQLSGQEVPALTRERVEAILPQFLVDKESEEPLRIRLTVGRETLEAYHRFTDVVDSQLPIGDLSQLATVRTIFVFPLLAIITLCDDALRSKRPRAPGNLPEYGPL